MAIDFAQVVASPQVGSGRSSWETKDPDSHLLAQALDLSQSLTSISQHLTCILALARPLTTSGQQLQLLCQDPALQENKTLSDFVCTQLLPSTQYWT